MNHLKASIASTDGTIDALVDKGAKFVIDTSNLVHYVGEPEVQAQRAYGDETTPVGVAMGLASNDTGGLIFYIETAKVEGSQQTGLMVKEKIIAAKRNGVKIIILPTANRRDVEMISSNDVEGLQFHFVDKYNEIYDIAFACDDPTMGHHSSEEIQRSPSPPRKVLF
nr:unnamed protein product [Digitaria exilis]